MEHLNIETLENKNIGTFEQWNMGTLIALILFKRLRLTLVTSIESMN